MDNCLSFISSEDLPLWETIIWDIILNEKQICHTNGRKTFSGQIVFISLHKEALKLKKTQLQNCVNQLTEVKCKTSSTPIFQKPNCVSLSTDFTNNACFLQIPHQPTSTDFRIDYPFHPTQNGSELTMPWKCSLCLGTFMQIDYRFLVTKKESWAMNWCTCGLILLNQGTDFPPI